MEDMTRPELTVVLPAYREEATINEAVTRLVTCLDDAGVTFVVRVVVDGPGDSTAEIVRRITDHRVSVIELDRNYGKGRAVRTGLRECESEYVGYIDADLDLHPEGLAEALRMLRLSQEDVYGAIGSKIHPLSTVDYPISRRMLSSIYKLLVKMAFSITLNDTQTGLKVFKREPVEMVLPTLQQDGFEFDLELLTCLSRAGGRFIEVPVNLDFHFSSTVNFRSGLRTIVNTILLAIHLRRAVDVTPRNEPR